MNGIEFSRSPHMRICSGCQVTQKKSPCKMYKFEWNFEQNECQILVLEWFFFAIHNHYDHMPLIIQRKAMTFKVMVLEKNHI